MYIPDFGGDRDGGGTEKTGTEKNCISGETAGFGELRVPENPTHPWRRNLNNSGVSPCPGRRKLEQRKTAFPERLQVSENCGFRRNQQTRGSGICTILAFHRVRGGENWNGENLQFPERLLVPEKQHTWRNGSGHFYISACSFRRDCWFRRSNTPGDTDLDISTFQRVWDGKRWDGEPNKTF